MHLVFVTLYIMSNLFGHGVILLKAFKRAHLLTFFLHTLSWSDASCFSNLENVICSQICSHLLWIILAVCIPATLQLSVKYRQKKTESNISTWKAKHIDTFTVMVSKAAVLIFPLCSSSSDSLDKEKPVQSTEFSSTFEMPDYVVWVALMNL